MKRVSFLMSVVLLGLTNLNAQNENVSRVGSINVVKELKPAILEIVPGSIQFVDASGNNAINAEEQCKIVFQVENVGTGDGYGCMLELGMSGQIGGINVERSRQLPVIKKGSTQTVEIPIQAGFYTADGSVLFSIDVTEPNGFGTGAHELNVSTRQFEEPLVKVTDYTVTGEMSDVIEKKKPFDLQVLMQNVEYGLAENVTLDVKIPENVMLIDGFKNQKFSMLNPGETKSLTWTLIVNNNYVGDIIPIDISIKEKHGRYSENRTINLAINQTFAPIKIDVSETDTQRDTIEVASLTSDVDKNIPVTNIKNKSTFAVIIANEDYHNVADVPFAVNDGAVFEKYCNRTLGIPQENIHFVKNATLNNLKAEINWLDNIADAYQDEAKIVFYYAGHGMPDEKEAHSEKGASSYILPVDGWGTDISTCYKLDELCNTLAQMPAKSVTVFLDACFSGSIRGGENGAINDDGRFPVIKAKSVAPKGNMVVFCASQGNETAHSYREQGHGLFTYYLLKKLQQSEGNVSYKDLSNYIETSVKQKSVVVNRKTQTPNVTSSVPGWEEWTFIK